MELSASPAVRAVGKSLRERLVVSSKRRKIERRSPPSSGDVVWIEPASGKNDGAVFAVSSNHEGCFWASSLDPVYGLGERALVVLDGGAATLDGRATEVWLLAPSTESSAIEKELAEAARFSRGPLGQSIVSFSDALSSLPEWRGAAEWIAGEIDDLVDGGGCASKNGKLYVDADEDETRGAMMQKRSLKWLQVLPRRRVR